METLKPSEVYRPFGKSRLLLKPRYLNSNTLMCPLTCLLRPGQVVPAQYSRICSSLRLAVCTRGPNYFL